MLTNHTVRIKKNLPLALIHCRNAHLQFLILVLCSETVIASCWRCSVEKHVCIKLWNWNLDIIATGDDGIMFLFLLMPQNHLVKQLSPGFTFLKPCR